MRPVDPVLTIALFRPDRAALLDLLSGLDAAEWHRPTACAGWSVKDVALHLLGGDLVNIAGRRDGRWALAPRSGEGMGAFLERINQDWVEAARRLSPRLIVEMLAESGPRLFDHMETLDPMATGGAVTWAGPGPAPVWLDIAREYTERWLHQQHVRDATGRPGQTDPQFLGPVIATFVHALPPAMDGADAAIGTAVAVEVDGEAGGRWAVARQASGWAVLAGRPDSPAGAADRCGHRLAPPDARPRRDRGPGARAVGGRRRAGRSPAAGRGDHRVGPNPQAAAGRGRVRI